jgi:hypothetical protein
MKKSVIVSLSLVFLSISHFSAFTQDKGTSLTPEQIIEKHLTAIGGKEKLATINTRVAMGLIKAPTAGQTKFLLISERPDKLTVLYKMPTYDWRITYASNDFFSIPIKILSNNVLLIGPSNKLENKFREMFSSGLLFGDMSLYNILTNPNSDIVMKAGKTKKINNRPTFVVEVRQKKTDLGKAYFDAETFMLVRIDYGSVEIPDTRIILDNTPKNTSIDFYQEFSDFRDVDGIKLPFKLKHVTIPPISPNQRASAVDVEITEYKHNLKIDPKLFSFN